MPNPVARYELYMIDETRGGKWPQGSHGCVSEAALSALLVERNVGRIREEGDYYVALTADGEEFNPSE